jgi:hypothetical protein
MKTKVSSIDIGNNVFKKLCGESWNTYKTQMTGWSTLGTSTSFALVMTFTPRAST